MGEKDMYLYFGAPIIYNPKKVYTFPIVENIDAPTWKDRLESLIRRYSIIKLKMRI